MGRVAATLHERSVEHVRDAESFSKKSHIVKHWISSHPELLHPPLFSFKITQQFKDCMSRQIAEALRIQNSQDSLLNSKCEYLQNCITRLTVNEEDWERKERERREEETEKQDVEKLEEFKKKKTRLRLSYPKQRMARCQEQNKNKTNVERKRKAETSPVGTTSSDRQKISRPNVENLAQGVATCTVSGPSQAVVGEGARHPLNKPNSWSSPDREGYDDLGLGVARSRVAVPSLAEVDKGKATHVQDRSAVPSLSKTQRVPKKKKIKIKENEYNLSCWSLWWRRMERQGAKEMMDRRVVGMQKSVLNYIQNEGTKLKPKSEPKYLCTTPQKRKGDMCMNPEIFQNQSASDSPAKRRKIRFNSLLSFWGGGGGEGVEIGTQFKNDTNIENIQTNNYSDKAPDWMLLDPWNNPIIGPVISSDSGDPTEVGEE